MSYSIETEDGYFLKIYRIFGGRNSTNFNKKNFRKVVFLQHGIFVIKIKEYIIS